MVVMDSRDIDSLNYCRGLGDVSIGIAQYAASMLTCRIPRHPRFQSDQFVSIKAHCEDFPSPGWRVVPRPNTDVVGVYRLSTAFLAFQGRSLDSVELQGQLKRWLERNS